jgi:hypothetical protein
MHIRVTLPDSARVVVLPLDTEMKAKGQWHHAALQDVLYVPEIHRNLLSVMQLLNHGACEGTPCRNLFRMHIRVTPPDSARVAVLPLDTFPDEGD